jgi:hypothetical protein
MNMPGYSTQLEAYIAGVIMTRVVPAISAGGVYYCHYNVLERPIDVHVKREDDLQEVGRITGGNPHAHVSGSAEFTRMMKDYARRDKEFSAFLQVADGS